MTPDEYFTSQVYRQTADGYQLVGRVGYLNKSAFDSFAFVYDESYLVATDAVEISHSLPLSAGTDLQHAAFFEGLLPEGMRRHDLARSIPADISDYAGMIRRLGNESIGALLFFPLGSQPVTHYDYQAISFNQIEAFAREPRQTATQMGMASRLSLSGAQHKIGLFHNGDDLARGWAIPEGSAPTTHILKTAEELFENQIINEAICLRAANICGFETAAATLIPTLAQPVLMVQRFDRYKDRIGVVRRLHQEDFCQASGFTSFMKYEPTDGHFANRCASLIAECSSNPFGDRMAFFQLLLFDYLIGNCDNHLKNYSFVWDSRWSGKELSPAYDITCTTIYPNLDRAMGVSLCAERSIDAVTTESIRETARAVRISPTRVHQFASELSGCIEDAVADATRAIGGEGFVAAEQVGSAIIADMQPRLAVCRKL